MQEMMAEGRYVRLGRFDAEAISQAIAVLLPLSPDEKKEYRERFLREYKNYSDRGRRRGEPKNEGCVWELHEPNELEHFDWFNPEIVARWLKEHEHTNYLKDNTKRKRKSFLENF